MGIKKIRNKIGRNIKSLRIEKGLSQEKLAEYVNKHIQRTSFMP